MTLVISQKTSRLGDYLFKFFGESWKTLNYISTGIRNTLNKEDIFASKHQTFVILTLIESVTYTSASNTDKLHRCIEIPNTHDWNNLEL